MDPPTTQKYKHGQIEVSTTSQGHNSNQQPTENISLSSEEHEHPSLQAILQCSTRKILHIKYNKQDSDSSEYDTPKATAVTTQQILQKLEHVAKDDIILEEYVPSTLTPPTNTGPAPPLQLNHNNS